ncbi:MAG: DUF6455 family protein [Pseudomonadota bacterium]
MKDFDNIDADLDLAFWLTRSIGRSIGLNFSLAMEEGRLAPEEFASLIATCRTCKHTASCMQWLGQAGGPRGADKAPDFCPNSKTLQALKPH